MFDVFRFYMNILDWKLPQTMSDASKTLLDTPYINGAFRAKHLSSITQVFPQGTIMFLLSELGKISSRNI